MNLAAMRQRAQSSPWVQQLISGSRVCRFSGHYLPRDMLLRVKPKQRAHGKSLLCIDELERYSPTVGPSSYLPLTGFYAAITDQTNRAVGELGWIRPDVVEHCARVLRLRSVAAMHRAQLEYFAHLKPIDSVGGPKGVTLSRLDASRVEVNRRVVAQDAMWRGPSVYLPLGDPLLSGEAMAWQLSDVLPAAGLQCIIELPATKPLSDRPLSVSSEACARTVWHALLSQHEANGAEDERRVNILNQHNTWKAFVMPGKPETHTEPTLSLEALEGIYRCLPPLTPSQLTVASDAAASRSKRRRAKKMATESAAPEPLSDVVSPKGAVVSYGYSLTRPGHPSAEVDGCATKEVPVYSARDIFGLATASTVIPWLLQVPMGGVAGEQEATRYVGVVALPCTAELATQLHRVVTFVGSL
ncbi:hypothetical protein IWW39_003156 [Coemansia spiralis]|uniref:Uncharacterized protein n=1 Tax=Coemansia spiralis TaxID=417178 RepID=A0A9W8L3V7_9FUNG|nr:hypothetical protein IWW39_003156 [Coemansia spiralis]